ERADLLERISVALFIPDERKRAEFRRVAYDEKLNTVAVKVFGIRSCDSWALEGRRLVPIPPRANPETIFTGLANAAANKMVLLNAKLPPIEESRTSKIPLPRHLPTDFSCFDDALAILDRRYEEVSEDVLEAARLLVPGYDPELDGVDEVKTEPNQASEEEKNSISEKVAEPESVLPPEPEPSLPPGNEAFEAFLRDHNESPSSSPQPRAVPSHLAHHPGGGSRPVRVRPSRGPRIPPGTAAKKRRRSPSPTDGPSSVAPSAEEVQTLARSSTWAAQSQDHSFSKPPKRDRRHSGKGRGRFQIEEVPLPSSIPDTYAHLEERAPATPTSVSIAEQDGADPPATYHLLEDDFPEDDPTAPALPIPAPIFPSKESSHGSPANSGMPTASAKGPIFISTRPRHLPQPRGLSSSSTRTVIGPPSQSSFSAPATPSRTTLIPSSPSLAPRHPRIPPFIPTSAPSHSAPTTVITPNMLAPPPSPVKSPAEAEDFASSIRSSRAPIQVSVTNSMSNPATTPRVIRFLGAASSSGTRTAVSTSGKPVIVLQPRKTALSGSSAISTSSARMISTAVTSLAGRPITQASVAASPKLISKPKMIVLDLASAADQSKVARSAPRLTGVLQASGFMAETRTDVSSPPDPSAPATLSDRGALQSPAASTATLKEALVDEQPPRVIHATEASVSTNVGGQYSLWLIFFVLRKPTALSGSSAISTSSARMISTAVTSLAGRPITQASVAASPKLISKPKMIVLDLASAADQSKVARSAPRLTGVLQASGFMAETRTDVSSPPDPSAPATLSDRGSLQSPAASTATLKEALVDEQPPRVIHATEASVSTNVGEETVSSAQHDTPNIPGALLRLPGGVILTEDGTVVPPSTKT
ncbi:unnamed protein product, partial [Cyprideis torosa]